MDGRRSIGVEDRPLSGGAEGGGWSGDGRDFHRKNLIGFSGGVWKQGHFDGSGIGAGRNDGRLGLRGKIFASHR